MLGGFLDFLSKVDVFDTLRNDAGLERLCGAAIAS